MQYKCPECGAYLDPGERCDCVRASASAVRLLISKRIKTRQKKNISPHRQMIRYAH